MDREPLFVAAVLAVFGVGWGVAGCTPNIGDRCSVSTDCSVRGDRVCDTSQPNGYCTLFNCTSNSCPNSAACVEFNASVPGCPYDDYHSPSRTGRTFCMATCSSDSDCRQSDGYVCRAPSAPPWSAVVLDSNSSRRICIVAPRSTPPAATADAAVCSASPPTSPADASVVASDAAGSAETGVDAGDAELFPADVLAGSVSDASVDAGGDAAAESDVSDGPVGG